MFTVWIFLTAFVLAEGVFSVFRSQRLYRLFRSSRPNEVECGRVADPPLPCGEFARDPFPRVALLAPCKGVDPNLRENIASWLSQQYPKYKIFFIVESTDDPAVQIIRDATDPAGKDARPPESLGEARPPEVLVAGQATDCGQKVHNLQYAIENLPGEFEVYAFIDSDAKVNPDWLNELVAALQRNANGGATGYRWFVSSTKNFAGQLRAVWNSGVLTLYTEQGKDNFFLGWRQRHFSPNFFRLQRFRYVERFGER